MNNKYIMPHILLGYPDLNISIEILKTLSKADIYGIILGIPFSDPQGEESFIMQANEEAVKHIDTNKVFDIIKDINMEKDIYISAYANIVFSYGIESFGKKCAECGVKGVLLYDVPFEEKDVFADILKDYNIKVISFITPTYDNADKMKNLIKSAEIFLYAMPYLYSKDIVESHKYLTDTIKAINPLPVFINYDLMKGVKNSVDSMTDGYIIDKSILEITAEYREKAPDKIMELLNSL